MLAIFGFETQADGSFKASPARMGARATWFLVMLVVFSVIFAKTNFMAKAN